MAIEAAEVLVTSEDTLVSKPKVTRVEVTRPFNDETFEYDENTAVNVWAAYDFLDVTTGQIVTDTQWREYLLEGPPGVPQNVVLYHLARIDAAIYTEAPTGTDFFYPTEPELPTEPA